MAEQKNALDATAPVSVWKKPIKADLKEVFKSASKAVVHVVTGKPVETISDVTDAAAAAGLSTTPGELAFVLVHRAIKSAILELIREVTPLDIKTDSDLAGRLPDQMDFSLADQPFEIDQNFFHSPGAHPIVGLVALLLEQWFDLQQVPKAVATALVRRFPSYFVYSLQSIWRQQGSSFSILREAMNTPFSDASGRLDAWKENTALLQKRVHEGVFGESFGLVDLYVPLYAYALDNRKTNEAASTSESYNTGDDVDTTTQEQSITDPDLGTKLIDSNTKREVRHVFLLSDELTNWVDGKSEVNLHVRMLSGGPGAGKSTVMRILAAQWAQAGHYVLFVPLHLLPEPSGNVLIDVERYVAASGMFAQNPLDSKLKEKLVIIFDGLDELASRGRVAADVARAFIRAVDNAVALRNQQEIYIRALVSGRDIVVQENEADFNKPRQIIHLLPYWTAESDRVDRDGIIWIDKDKLLGHDLRDQWWRQYSKLRGEAWQGLPEEFRRADLNEVTAQPLLNYLVSLTKLRDQLDLSKEVTINAIYEGLVKAVHERGYEKRGTHAAIRHMPFQDYVRVLEEVALAAWHGSDGRTTTVQNIERHCQNAGLNRLLKTFQEEAKTGITRLLLAFFFRKQGHDVAGEDTFEFTHKSFGEYLTARRLIRGMERIVKEMSDKDENVDAGWNEKQSLQEWIQLTGPTDTSPYLYQMWKNEVARRPYQEVNQWQEIFVRLFGYTLRTGMPIETASGLHFLEMLAYSRNSEESLMAALNSCALATQKISMIKHPNPNAFGNWIRRVQGQRVAEENKLVMRCLSYLNLKDVSLHSIDFFKADVSFSDLQACKLMMANLEGADLQGANCREANFEQVDLRMAKLQGADLRSAQLQGVNLQSARLNATKLQGAKLSGANLQKAILEDGDLKDADLDEAQLQGAIMKGVDLTNAQLKGANLQGADMRESHLYGANFQRANLRAANLFGVNLENVDFHGADLSGANIGQTLLAYSIRHPVITNPGHPRSGT